jgi:NAD(P)-dependent dehydrogenase (short-subunit alcohol dehydrogenase family)
LACHDHVWSHEQTWHNRLKWRPLGRFSDKPEEVARCVTFLANDAAGFITGSTLTANGGQYMI